MIAGGLAALAAAEWLRGNVAAWAWLAGVAGLAAAALALPPRLYRGPVAAAAALATIALGVVLVVGALDVRRIECCWPALREQRVTAASRALAATLGDAITEARRLAQQAARASLLPREAAFARLDEAVAGGPAAIERGVAILGGEGDPIAWAGRHRVVPAPDSAELQAVITPFYAVLEARRQAQAGTAVGTVLLGAAPAVAEQDRAVAAQFASAHGVTLRLFGPGLGPRDSSVFEFCPAGCDHGGPLFSVQTLPPSQGDAKIAAVARTTRFATVALALSLVLLLAAASPGAPRWGVAGIAAWTLQRAPLGPAVLFSPATFYRPVLGAVSTSAGALLVAAILLLAAAGVVWRRAGPRRWWATAAAALLVLAAPYLVRYFGRGIAPPAGGVSIGLWLSWQAALAATAMALVLLAAALVRGRDEPARVPWTLPAAGAWAALAAVAGLWLWSPYGAWPEWYTFLWLPALFGVIVPAPRRWALPGIAVVAGTAAALVTWGAAVEGRLALAERDAQRLGAEGDALAVALLERVGQQVGTQRPPHSAGDLYALWLASPLAGQDYPTALALWDRDGRPIAEIRLAPLDLPPGLLSALAGSSGGAPGPRVERFDRIPGVHYVLVAPLATGEILTVGVGPRTWYLPPDRTARFLRGDPGVELPYAISLSLPAAGAPTAPVPFRWRRAGWAARGERQVEMVGGRRHVHLRVDLRGPWALLVRGALVVLLDVALLGVVWLFALVVAEGWRPRRPALVSALRTSYRARLTAALVTFFVLPVLGFAAWSFARLADEARRSGDLLIRQTLRDAAGSAETIAGDRPETVGGAVVDLGRRLDAELWLYRNGLLAATSSPVMRELGLVDPFLTPQAFLRLTLQDELELTMDARTAGRPTRVGYLVVAPGPAPEQAILAVPRLLDDELVRRQQEDLALILVLATLAGLGAAAYLAGLVARGLAKPVAALRDAALAVGRGSVPPAFSPGAPREFEPVLSAFERMVTDVRRSQGAIEEARQRTARVLANVATGVIAVDDALRVTMANPRAAEVLGEPLTPGDVLPQAAPPEWGPVWQAVDAFVAAKHDTIAEREFEIGGRQIRVQLAPLGPSPDGCVIALDDATALTRAARVLAWGEMARQVAHEIKNPLTPIRLGIQHLQRVQRGSGGGGGGGGGGPGSFEATLRETAERILVEIDRLDGIARAFSRFGAPAAEQLPLEPVDLAGAAREVVQLYGLGSGEASAARFEVRVEPGAAPALARKDEVKEVLVNLLENARNAEATRVTVSVAGGGRRLTVVDDGRGIAADALPRVFEPTFSTTSSGSGLGLAIARRLVESWGGGIALESEPGRGTTVTLTLQAAAR
ncbi:MAG TPA: ATP-binding protein [Gemmatimonadales bacterium]|nr:ATP-binding protein [Gemmatimonadales bacterium]